MSQALTPATNLTAQQPAATGNVADFESRIVTIAKRPGSGWRGIRNLLTGRWRLPATMARRIGDLATSRGASLKILNDRATSFRCVVYGRPAAVRSTIEALITNHAQIVRPREGSR